MLAVRAHVLNAPNDRRMHLPICEHTLIRLYAYMTIRIHDYTHTKAYIRMQPEDQVLSACHVSTHSPELPGRLVQVRLGQILLGVIGPGLDVPN